MTTLTELRALALVDHATGVAGTYCIGRRDPKGFWSYWNPSGWAGSGYVFEDRKLAERVLAMIAVIEAAKAIDYEMFNGMTPSVGSANKLKRTLAALDKEKP